MLKEDPFQELLERLELPPERIRPLIAEMKRYCLQYSSLLSFHSTHLVLEMCQIRSALMYPLPMRELVQKLVFASSFAQLVDPDRQSWPLDERTILEHFDTWLKYGRMRAASVRQMTASVRQMAAVASASMGAFASSRLGPRNLHVVLAPDASRACYMNILKSYFYLRFIGHGHIYSRHEVEEAITEADMQACRSVVQRRKQRQIEEEKRVSKGRSPWIKNKIRVVTRHRKPTTSAESALPLPRTASA